MHPPSDHVAAVIPTIARNLLPNILFTTDRTAARIAPSCANIIFSWT